MVIGAYIVTSYFIFVEKYPDKSQEEIYEAIEGVINKIIEEGHQQKSSETRHPKLEDKNSYFPQDTQNNMDFKLDRLVDSKSSRFISQFDQQISNIFQNVKLAEL